MSLRSWLLIPGLMSVVFWVGCAGGEPVEELVPVGGKLLVDGEPLDGVVVTFIPEKSAGGRGGSGETDASGSFTVTHTSQQQPGLPPGKYTLVYSRMRRPDGSAAPKPEAGAPVDPANIQVETLPSHLTTPSSTAALTQVDIPQAGNTNLELSISTK